MAAREVGYGVAIASYHPLLERRHLRPRPPPRFAEAYADQNERDDAALKTAVETGEVPAEFGL